MTHISPERLAELALDAAEHDAHLDACDVCRAELATLRAEVGHLRAAAVSPEPLPAGLWTRIAAEIAEPETMAGIRTSGDADDAITGAAVPLRDDSRANDHVAPRRARRARGIRRFSAGALALACVATAVVVGGVALGVGVLANRTNPGTVVAAAPLEPLTGGLAPASAEVVERDGRQVLVLDTGALPAADGYFDVWLIDTDVQGMINVGILDAGTQEYVLPEGVDIGRFPIVDVSVEPFDGDPTHSGESIWRGQLQS
ncbi:Anti-sigma-K factor rskA [Agrococcus baldri]|uniref:Anti-sigma-K factor rskA n=1 Tax=Agrococcus baldri TaxID=153730 RepID=A0AA94HL67_9MICO|nr:anti-sigma factor [Agrococcus baldri]SFR99359.1 Anti-sigma-K factor rskA [Agrococcus baldri]